MKNKILKRGLFFSILILICINFSQASTIENETFLMIDDMEVQINGTSTTSLQISHAENVIIMSTSILWNPSVLNLDYIDTSMSLFDMTFYLIDNDTGLFNISVFNFGVGLYGDLYICDLIFSASEEAEPGDYCYLNLSEYTIWNFTQDTVPVLSENGTALVGDPQIDINQPGYERGFPIRHTLDGDWSGAQTFIPTRDLLSKIELCIRKFGTPEFNLMIELREDNPTGKLVQSMSFQPEEIDTSWTWLTVDFNNVFLKTNTSYCILIPSIEIFSSNGYEWGYIHKDLYPNGSFWFTRDGGENWHDLADNYEFSFRTYGYEL